MSCASLFHHTTEAPHDQTPAISTLVLGTDPSAPRCALPRSPAGRVVPVVRSLCPLVPDQRRRLFARSSLAILDDHPARRLLGRHAGVRARPSHCLSLAWSWLRARPAGPLAPPHHDQPGPQARDARVPRAGRPGLGIRDQGRMDPLARLHAAASTLTRLTGSCPRSSSLPSGPTPPASCAPPAAANPGIRRVGCGDGRLLTERERSVPRGRTAPFSPI